MSLPNDRAAYERLLLRVECASTREALLALVGDVVIFEGDKFRPDFTRAWRVNWATRGFGDVPLGAWPPRAFERVEFIPADPSGWRRT